MSKRSPEKFHREEAEEKAEEENQVETTEVLNTKELFEALVDSGLAAFKDREKIERELEKKDGIEKGDIDIAMKGMMCLTVLNSVVFKDSIGLYFSPRKGRSEENLIEYIPEGKDQEEQYKIQVEDFAKAIRDVAKNKERKILFDERGKMIEDIEKAPSVSEEELLISIAAHEVRHRLQKRGTVNMISPGKAVVYHGESLSDLIKFEEFDFQQQRKKLREKGKSEDYIERITGPKEFDAGVVERLVVDTIHYQGASLEQLNELINIQPES